MSRDENNEGELLSSDLSTGPTQPYMAAGGPGSAHPFPRNHSHRERAWRPLATAKRNANSLIVFMAKS
jgi:hypothetical protein